MTSTRILAGCIVACAFGGGASRGMAQTTENAPAEGAVGGPYRVIAADFTGDGVLDLAVAYHAIGVVTVEAGNGKGGFTRVETLDVSVPAPSAIRGVYNVAQGDIDNDGCLDLAFTVHGTPPDEWRMKDVPPDVLQSAWRGRAVVARNTRGRFSIVAGYPINSQAAGVRLADLDRDGRPDLLYTARGSGYKGDLPSGRLYVRRGMTGDEAFGPAIESEAGPSAYYVETADLNGDGFLDIVVPNEHGASVQVWINPGKSIFQNQRDFVRKTVTVTPIPGARSHAVNDVRAADLTGDGRPDLVTANLGTSTVSVFPANGDGTFQPDTSLDGGVDCAFLAIGDLNRDGAADFVITHWTGDFLSVFLNAGGGKFATRKDYKTGMGNYGVTLADLNGDGTLDVVTANYRERSLSVLMGTGDGTFRPAVTTPKGLRRRGGSWVDEKAAP